ncbi:RNA cap guanine-N2 methyltransferase [Arabidopsis thaliana x Arabidopsis arenosa]|uniref:Trimethylguanosine synthase n=2 Tax=Arabidopsis TaxID=3701 RepID=A0A8T2C369_9BRAS|nr:RNA cap guanine-N2 methyltransferase [Arabidopsis thaliana x Arabidopsis arenosa]KAG7593440.1 RNA cap guanine-N2 methyltransferase [Arabidopsis thaliana x Arabidopsis arenosa]
MDEEGWYSVTPEEIAIKQAQRCRGKVVIDCFSGVGGNTIQFAKVCSSVVAIDIDPMKTAFAMNNAKVYGVANRIDFVTGDFMQLAPSLKGDVLFLSPPWGGPAYSKVESYKLDMLLPRDGYSLFQTALSITPNIIMFLPKNVDLAQLEELAWLSSPPLTLEIEESCVGGEIKAITAYFSIERVDSLTHESHNMTRSMKLKKRSRLKKEVKSSIEKENGSSHKITKYWIQRYDLFSRYDQGIELDEEGWYSVTPEVIAIKQARRCRGKVVIDCFSGVGGNTIQFAKVCSSVVAIDIDPVKVELAMNNAMVYGVANRVDFVIGDFIQLAPSLKGDVVFLSPPWGGPMYRDVESYKLDMLQPRDGYSLFQIAQSITPNIIMFLPRNVDLAQVEELAWLSSPPLTLEIEENFVGGRMKAVTAYFSCNAV